MLYYLIENELIMYKNHLTTRSIFNDMVWENNMTMKIIRSKIYLNITYDLDFNHSSCKCHISKISQISPDTIVRKNKVIYLILAINKHTTYSSF